MYSFYMTTQEKIEDAAANAAYYDTPGADAFDAMLTAAIARHDAHAEFRAAQASECLLCGATAMVEHHCLKCGAWEEVD